MTFKGPFRSFAFRNFRLFMSSQVISMTGIWVQRMTTVWLVLSLTQSPFLSSLNDFASQVPILIMGLFSGAVVDRVDKRLLIQRTQFLLLLLAATLGTLTLTGSITFFWILVTSIALGATNAFDMPARQACISLMVDRSCLHNAIALNSAVFNLSRVIGPTLAGIIVAGVGEGYCYVLTGVAFVAPIVALALMCLPPEPIPAARPPVLQSVREGLIYVREYWPLKVVLILLCAVSFLGMPIYVTFSSYVKLVLHEDATLFGMILGGVGGGALIATITIATLPDIRTFPRKILLALLTMGIGLSMMPFLENRYLLILMSMLVGGGLVFSTTGCNTILQTFVSDDMRGRVMSLYVMSFSGFAPLGSLATGFLMDQVSIRSAILFQGVLSFVTALIYMRLIRRLSSEIDQHYASQRHKTNI